MVTRPHGIAQLVLVYCLRYWLDKAISVTGCSNEGILHLRTTSRLAFGSTLSVANLKRGAFRKGLKWPKHEIN